MNISTLPPELQLSVCERLDPSSGFNFAIASKTHWNLFTPVIQEHARLFAENKCLRTSSAEQFIWNKCREIMSNPHHGWYVRELSVRNDRYYDSNVWALFQLTVQCMRPPPEVVEPLLEAAHDIKSLYEKSLGGPDPPWPTMEQAILDGSPEPIIALLIHYLPNLKIFRYTDGAGDPFTTFEMVESIARAYAAPVRAPHLPFEHLTTIMIAHWDSEGCADLAFCLMFMAIPSVRTFVGWQMGDGCEEEFPAPSKSQVKDLIFEHSQFDDGALGRILKNVEALQRFSYAAGGATVSYDFVAPKRVIKSLASYAGHSLENLILDFTDDDGGEDLDTNDNDEDFSLRDFKTLKTLQCDWKSIKTDIDDIYSDADEELPERGFYTEQPRPVKDFDPRSILPASLESLHLTGYFTDEEWDALTELLDEPSDYTPNLRSIRLSKQVAWNDRRHWTSSGTAEDAHLPHTAWRKSFNKLIQGHSY